MARRDEGADPPAICDRGATKPVGLFRENPPGDGSFVCGLRCLGRHSPLRGCPGLAALGTAKLPRRRTPRNFKTGSEEKIMTGHANSTTGTSGLPPGNALIKADFSKRSRRMLIVISPFRLLLANIPRWGLKYSLLVFSSKSVFGARKDGLKWIGSFKPQNTEYGRLLGAIIRGETKAG